MLPLGTLPDGGHDGFIRLAVMKHVNADLLTLDLQHLHIFLTFSLYLIPFIIHTLGVVLIQSPFFGLDMKIIREEEISKVGRMVSGEMDWSRNLYLRRLEVFYHS